MGRRGNNREMGYELMIYLLYALCGVFIFLLGAAWFSFLNVVIYRLPRGISVAKGNSFCPDCHAKLRAIDMVPCLSWLFLRRKCHFCGGAISPRYFVVELLGGVSSLLCAAAWGVSTNGLFGLSWQALLCLVVLGLLTAIAYIDADTQEIPNRLVIAIFLCGVAALFAFPAVTWQQRVIGLVAVSVPMLLVTLFVPGGFGGGDIKLMAAVGLFLGWKQCVFAVFVAVLGGGIYGAWLLITKRKGGKEHFAFGPFLCAGTVLSMLVGAQITAWYLGLLAF